MPNHHINPINQARPTMEWQLRFFLKNFVFHLRLNKKTQTPYIRIAAAFISMLFKIIHGSDCKNSCTHLLSCRLSAGGSSVFVPLER